MAAAAWVSPIHGNTCLFMNSGVSLTVYYMVQFLQMEASVLQPSGRSQIRKLLAREGTASRILFGTLWKKGLWLSLRKWLLIYT